MLYGVSAFYFLGAFIPLLIASRMVKLDKNLLLMGWLSWVAGVAVKMLLASIIALNFPLLYIPDTVQYIVIITLLETTEVASAWLFLMYHPLLKKVRNVRSLFVFGLGFGAGEALTLALFTFLPVDSPLTWNLLLTSLERFSAIMIHVASILFIGYWIINKRKSNMWLGILSKDLSVTMTFGLLAILSFSYQTFLPYIEVLLFSYGAGFLYLAFWVAKKQKIKLGTVKPQKGINYKSLFFMIPLGAGLLLLTELVSIFLSSQDPISFIMVSMGVMFVLTISIFKMITLFRDVSITEFSSGVFIGLSIARVVELSFVDPAYLGAVPVQSLLTTPMLFFSVVIGVMTVYRFIHKEKLLG